MKEERNGFINVFKEAGYTSHDVVAKMRGITGFRKIGHMGTLDPEATGVLPLCLGRATKAVALMGDHNKSYRAVLHLGLETDTEDMSGKILVRKPVSSDSDEVKAVIQSFVGRRDQVPPMYSAKKVKGKKLYEYAREGQILDLDPVPVEIMEIRIEKVELPLVSFFVRCSSGTYIRSLCRDIGRRLGCGGCMESLVRTGAGIFSIDQAKTLEEIEEIRDQGKLDSIILPVDSVFKDLPAFRASDFVNKKVQNGNPIPQSAVVMTEPGREEIRLRTDRFRLYDDRGIFIGIYQPTVQNTLKPVKIFINL